MSYLQVYLVEIIDWWLITNRLTLLVGTNASNISDLLQTASEVGKAVESLVTIMTDDEQ